MWRINEVAGDELRRAADINGNMLILLSPDDASLWKRSLSGESGEELDATDPALLDSPWISASLSSQGRIAVTLHAEGSSIPGKEDNAGDRQLVEALLKALVQQSLSSLPIEDILGRLLPTKQKRMLQVIRQSDVLMRPTRVSARTVVPAVTGRLLDDLGRWLTGQGLAEGPIPPNERTNVLRLAVDYYLRRLGDRLAQLSPRGLLQYMVLRDDALLRDGAMRNEYLPSRLACFGPDTVHVQELVQAERKHMEASVASRFLVEFVAANPPFGDVEIDLFLYDELLGCAAELISRATLSDAIHYGFSDVQLSMLQSGRLGVSRGDRYTAGTQDLLETEMEARRTLAVEPHPRKNNSPRLPLDAMNAALAAEVGFTFTDLMNGLGTLITLGDEVGGEPATVHKEVVIARLMADRSWDGVKIEAFVEALSLGPRQDFMSDRDAWPWKYNRDYSYIRRPIIRVHDEAHGIQLTWGVRRTWVTARYWGSSSRGRGTRVRRKLWHDSSALSGRAKMRSSRRMSRPSLASLDSPRPQHQSSASERGDLSRRLVMTLATLIPWVLTVGGESLSWLRQRISRWPVRRRSWPTKPGT